MPSGKHRNKFSQVLHNRMQSRNLHSKIHRLGPLLLVLLLHGCGSGDAETLTASTTSVPTATAPPIVFPALYDPLLSSVMIQPLRASWKESVGADFNDEFNALIQQYRDNYSNSPDRLIFGLWTTAIIEKWLVRFDLCTISKTPNDGFEIKYASAATSMADKIPEALEIMSRDWGRTSVFQAFAESSFTSIVDAINYRLGKSPEKLIGLRVFSASGTMLSLSFEPYFYIVQTQVI
jgi:hypothetical protein